MIVATECALCGRQGDLFNLDGLCKNPDEVEDPRPRINACEDLIAHLSSSLRKQGRARLRTKARTDQDARRILSYASRAAGLGVEFHMGESWVEAESTGEFTVTEEAKENAPRFVAHGFVIDDLDIAKLHLDHIEAKRKANLYAEMAKVEDGWQDAAVSAWKEANQLRDLIEAWEERHGNGKAD